MKLPILPLNQRDERWKLKKLGTSSTTIGNYGCLLTCHSMMLKYYGHDLLPDALNAVYVEKKVFDQENKEEAMINFWAAADCFEDITTDEYYACLNDPCDLSKIDKYLDAKKPVIAMVDFSPTAGVQTHFVLIIGKENESYLINDPWTGETYFFEAKYGDPARYIFGLRLYSGKPKEVVSDVDKISDLEVKINSLNEQLAKTQLENNNLRTALEAQERDNKDLGNQLLEARKQRDTAIAEQKLLEVKVAGFVEQNDELEKGIKTLDETNEGLREALKASQSVILAKTSTWEMLKIIYRRFVGRG